MRRVSVLWNRNVGMPEVMEKSVSQRGEALAAGLFGLELRDEENRAANRSQRIIEPQMQVLVAVFMARNLTMNARESKRGGPGR